MITWTSERPVSIVLVDDHKVTRLGVKQSICRDPKIKVIGEAECADDAVNLIGQLHPDMAIVDIRLKEGSGIEMTRAARNIAPSTKVLIFTAYDDPQYVSALVKLGVSGYLLKNTSGAELRKRIHETASGKFVMSDQISARMVDYFYRRERGDSPKASKTGHLTPRQSEVLDLVSRGFRNAEIAERLGIALKTVEVHIGLVFTNLGVRNRAEAVIAALNAEPIQEEE